MSSLTYRFTIVDPTLNSGANLFTPGMATVPAVHWSVNSKRGDPRAFIESPPSGDGQEVDLVTGKVSDGSYTVPVLDLVATAGGTTGTSDEMDDPQIYARWSKNYTGTDLGNPWGWGFISYPAVAGSDVGATVGGSHTVAAGTQIWLARTFTGLTPSTQYTVSARVYNRGAAAVLGFFPGAPAAPPVPFIRNGLTSAVGQMRYPPLVTPPNNPVAEILQIPVTSDAGGNLSVDVGVGFGVACAVFSWVIGFDWVRITEGTPAATGRYSTIALASDGARQQVLGRPAYIETSGDEGGTWDRVLHSGYITAIRLPNSLVYEYDVGDTRRVERVTQAFKTVERQNGASLVALGNGTPLIGGPSRDGWDPYLPNIGLPTFRITEAYPSVYTDNAITTQGEVVLTYESGPMPEAYNGTGDNFNRANFDIVNERARPCWVADASVPTRIGPNGQRMSQGLFPRMRVQIVDTWGDWQNDPRAGVADIFAPFSWQFSTQSALRVLARNLLQTKPPQDALFGEGGRLRIPWDAPDDGIIELPTVGGKVQLRVYPLDVSEDAPLHLVGHPVDLAQLLYLDNNVPADSTSATSVRNALGAQCDTRIRITKPQSIQSFLEGLFAVFGFSTRIEDGVRVFFTTRAKSYLSPSVTITDATLREEGGPTFDLNESSKINQVRYRQKRFAIHPEDNALQRPWDDIEEKETDVTADLVSSWSDRAGNGLPISYFRGYLPITLDADTLGEREQSFAFDGQVWISGIGELPAAGFARGIAERAFDRRGRGEQTTTLVCRAGAGVDDVRIGDEVGVDISHHPNAQFQRTPSSQRGGARVATVIRREESPEGPTLTVVDAGTGTQPFDIAPIAGRWTASVDPTNNAIAILDLNPLTSTYSGGTLGAACSIAGARVVVRVAFAATEPTTDEGIEYTILDPSENVWTPTSPGAPYDLLKFPLGPFATTTGLWVRLQTFVPGATPSAPSDWVNVVVGAPPGLGTISGLTVTGADDTSISLSWVNTDTLQPATVSFRETALGGSYTIATILPAGSTRYNLTGLTANTSYDITVSLTDGTTLSVTQATTNSGTTQLPPPVNPVAIGNGAGNVGLRVVSVHSPATIVFEMAIETAVGSGLPGAYGEYARAGALLNQYVGQTATVANDGLLRYVRAKLTWPGYLDSAYTSPLPVDPWNTGTLPVPAPPGWPIIIPPGAPPPSIPPGTPGSPFYGRLIVQLAATALASNTDNTTTMWASRGSVAYRVSANKPSRVRLYDSAAARTADTARGTGTEPYSGDGLVLDVVCADADSRLVELNPRVILGNVDRGPTVVTLYAAITNLTSGTADILVEIDVAPYET